MITKTINILILLFIICFNHSFAYEVSNNGKKLIKEYDDMKSDYIQLVKNTKFPTPEKEDSMSNGEKSLEDIIADIVKKGK